MLQTRLVDCSNIVPGHTAFNLETGCKRAHLMKSNNVEDHLPDSPTWSSSAEGLVTPLSNNHTRRSASAAVSVLRLDAEWDRQQGGWANIREISLSSFPQVKFWSYLEQVCRTSGSRRKLVWGIRVSNPVSLAIQGFLTSCTFSAHRSSIEIKGSTDCVGDKSNLGLCGTDLAGNNLREA